MFSWRYMNLESEDLAWKRNLYWVCHLLSELNPSNVELKNCIFSSIKLAQR